MWRAHRGSVEADRFIHIETLDEVGDCIAKRFPAKIRFRPGQEQERLALAVAQDPHIELQVCNVCDFSMGECHRWAS